MTWRSRLLSHWVKMKTADARVVSVWMQETLFQTMQIYSVITKVSITRRVHHTQCLVVHVRSWYELMLCTFPNKLLVLSIVHFPFISANLPSPVLGFLPLEVACACLALPTLPRKICRQISSSTQWHIQEVLRVLEHPLKLRDTLRSYSDI